MPVIPPPPIHIPIMSGDRVASVWLGWFEKVYRQITVHVKLSEPQSVIDLAEIEYANNFTSEYFKYILELRNIQVSTNGSTLYLRFTEDGSQFVESMVYRDYDGDLSNLIKLDQITLTNDPNGFLNGEITILAPTDDSVPTFVSWNLKFSDSDLNVESAVGSSTYTSLSSVVGVKLSLTAGSYTSGKQILYGVK